MPLRPATEPDATGTGPALLIYPDPRLRRPAEPVVVFDAALSLLVEHICEVMGSAGAIGLTAAHLGVAWRVMVVRMAGDREPRVYVNPVLLQGSSERATHEEGSVSMPGIRDRVERARTVRVAYHDLAGLTQEEDATGLRAAILQHEMDQLDGIFWLDRLSRLKRDRAVKRFGKIGRLATLE